MCLTLWNFRPLFHPKVLFGTHLLILTNEAEARPCGGFITGYGEVRLFPPKFVINNVYDFEVFSLGPAPEPIDLVNPELKFWDLSYDRSLDVCSEAIKGAYSEFSGKEIGRVLLVNFGTFERIYELLGPLSIEGKKMSLSELFTTISRSVANVDRHSESDLKERKGILSVTGKKLIKKLVWAPWNLLPASFIFDQEFQRQNIFISGVSRDLVPHDHDIQVTEWNLGGAKSSRFLEKKVQILLEENQNETWSVVGSFSMTHQGNYDEPISTIWKGFVDYSFPDFITSQGFRMSGPIAPGEKKVQEFEFKNIQYPELKKIGFFLPRGQEILVDLTIRAYGQKILRSKSFETHENVGRLFTSISERQTCLRWDEIEDDISPFITFHEFVTRDRLSDELQAYFAQADHIVELHFNEPVELMSDFEIEFQDLDVANNNTVSPVVLSHKLLEGETTLLVGASGELVREERYGVGVNGVIDQRENLVDFQAKRTVIYRPIEELGKYKK